MSNAIKLVVGVLVLMLIGSGAFVYLLYNQTQDLQKNKTDLEQQLAELKERENKALAEKQSLSDQVQEAQNTRSKLQKQLSDLNTQVASVTGERDNWKNQVDTLRRERDELMVKLQEKPKEIIVEKEVVRPAPAVAPAGSTSVESPAEDQYWGSVLKEKAALELQIDEVKNQLSAANIEIEELKKSNSDFNLELGLLKNEKEEIQRKIKYTEDLANTLSIDLAREKNDKRFMDSRYQKIRDENSGLRSQIKELNSSKVALEKSLERLKGDKQKVEQKLSETESIIQNRINEVLEIKSSLDRRLQTSPGATAGSGSKEVELPPIIVSPSSNSSMMAETQGTTSLRPGLEGRVVSVNEENNFIIIDAGEGAGVRVGDRLNVYRGNQYIAGVEVIQVRKDISAADIKQKGAKIRVGDSIR